VENVFFINPDGSYMQICCDERSQKANVFRDPALLSNDDGTVTDFADICAAECPDLVVILDGDPAKIERLRQVRKHPFNICIPYQPEP